MKPIILTLPFLATEALREIVIPNSESPGFAKVIVVTIPNFTGTPTATITIFDNLGGVVYTKAALANNSRTYDEDHIIPVGPDFKVQILLSVVAGSVGDVVVTLYVI
jgi:hypothetical protein